MSDFIETFFAESLNKARAEARAEALAEGRAEARVTLLESIRALMDSLQLTAQAAMNLLKISPEKQKELAPLI